MNNNLQRDVQILNDLPLTAYLNLLGYHPTAARHGSVDYEVFIDDKAATTITVDCDTNQFSDPANNRHGGLVDFACLLFDITSVELCANIVTYRLDRLMSQHMVHFND